MTDFKKRITWFENYRLKNNRYWPNEEHSDGEQILLSLVPQKRLIFLLERLLNEAEFLSPGGIRALSKYHEKNPYTINIGGIDYHIKYDPGDSTSDFFGGNSNWRGPVWIPINYLIIQSIRQYGKFYGDGLMVEYPAGSGKKQTLEQVADHLTERVISLFKKDADRRAARCMESTTGSIKNRGTRTFCCSMNIFMAIPVMGWAPAIRPAGLRWWRS